MNYLKLVSVRRFSQDMSNVFTETYKHRKYSSKLEMKILKECPTN